MPLFKKKKKDSNAAAGPSTSTKATIDRTHPEAPTPSRFRHAPHLSKKPLSIGGLSVNVFGLEQLTPVVSRATAPAPPEVLVAVHMHGRGGTADQEEWIVRQLYDRQMRSTAEARSQGARHREMILVNFDARNHGHRLIDPQGQKSWKDGNPHHAMDLYAMLLGMAQDVSLIADLLPAYIFPNDERQITNWAVTGRSLGGHAVWHVLANDARFTIGLPFISCPDFAKLMRHRAQRTLIPAGPPHLPASLMQLVARVDPAARPFDVPDEYRNPFWGKRICVCNGQEDRLVPWACGEDFFQRLVVAPPQLQRHHLQFVLQPGIGHEVTELMVDRAGHFLYEHAVSSSGGLA